MPGVEAAYGAEYGVQDYYPAEEDAHAKLVSWCQQAFDAADSDRRSYYDRWVRYHKLYRSFLQRKKGDWRSKVFFPLSFWVVETITPRLVASFPEFIVLPVGPDDVAAAEQMETLLNWSVKESDLYVELTKAVKSKLKYGTGILKTFWEQRTEQRPERVPRMEPVFEEQPEELADETGNLVLDFDGQPIRQTTQVQVGEQLVGYEFRKRDYVTYEGPAALSVDIADFWVSPGSQDIQDARYVIHRSYVSLEHVMEKVAEGVYRWPEHLGPDDISNLLDEGARDRAAEIGEEGPATDPTRHDVELLEFWTWDGRLITMVNRKAILRHTDNPFFHGQKPFIRIVDYLQEHEFWGVGELEPLEGIQDLINALVNQRIDNVRLALDKMFAVNTKEIMSRKQLQWRPGGVIEFSGDLPIQQVIQTLDIGDITQSAFVEADYAERVAEKVSGVTAYQMGMDSASLNRTATGVSLITESGNARFLMKTRLMELVGLRPLARQFGALWQQFLDSERAIRMLGPKGEVLFSRFSPESIQGSMDFQVEAASSTQTETVRKDQALTLFNTVAPAWPPAAPALVENVLKEFGIKDFERYLGSNDQGAGPGMPLPGQEDPMAAMMGGVPPGAAPPGGAPAPEEEYAFPGR